MRFCLGKTNFIVMAIAALLIIVGFVLMWGEPSTPDHFNPEVFSDRRVVYGPNLSFLGYILMIVAIMIPNNKTGNKTEE